MILDNLFQFEGQYCNLVGTMLNYSYPEDKERGIVSDEALMDTSQVAHYLNMHPKTIVSMVERGELKAYKVGRHWRYRKSDIDAFLEQRQNITRADEGDRKEGTDEQSEKPE